MIDEKRIKRFIKGAKEAFKKVDNPTFTFPMTILSAYELATSIEELLKEQEAVVRCKYCKKCDLPEEPPYEDGYCSRCGYVKMDWFCADGERK